MSLRPRWRYRGSLLTNTELALFPHKLALVLGSPEDHHWPRSVSVDGGMVSSNCEWLNTAIQLREKDTDFYSMDLCHSTSLKELIHQFYIWSWTPSSILHGAQAVSLAIGWGRWVELIWIIWINFHALCSFIVLSVKPPMFICILPFSTWVILITLLLDVINT